MEADGQEGDSLIDDSNENDEEMLNHVMSGAGALQGAKICTERGGSGFVSSDYLDHVMKDLEYFDSILLNDIEIYDHCLRTGNRR